MDNYQVFCQFMVEYVNFFEATLLVEKEKLEALLSHELKQMEHSISAQQAVAMKLENLEKKRMELQTKAGFGNKSFKEIIDMVDETKAAELKVIFTKLEDAINSVRFYNDKSMDIVKMNIQTIDGAASPSERNEAQGYSSSKEKTSSFGNSTMFETKI